MIQVPYNPSFILRGLRQHGRSPNRVKAPAQGGTAMPANGRWPYCDPRWTTITKLVKARDGYRCVALGPKHSRILDVDHIIEWTKRPDLAFEPANLRTLCRLHHNRKTHGKRRRNSRRW